MASVSRQRRWITSEMEESGFRNGEDFLERSPYESEVSAWSNINHCLRRQGYAKVKLLHPADVSLISDQVVCIDIATSETLRETLETLLSDRSEEQGSLIDKYQAKVKDLKVMLECSRARVQELEQELRCKSLQDTEDGERLRNTKNAIASRHRQLEQQCQEQELELDMLRKRLKRMCDEDAKRTKRQNQVFMEFKKRTTRAHSVMDEKLLDVIDAYERQVNTLQRELDMSRSGVSFHEDHDDSNISFHSNPSQNVKSIIRTYEKKLQALQLRVKHSEEEKELMQLDMGSKPDVKDYRLVTQRVKKLEKLLALHNISVPGEKITKDPFRLKKKYSTRVEDLDYLPLDFCQQYLKDLSSELGVSDIDRLSMAAQSLKEDVQEHKRFEGFCRKVHNIIQSVDETNQGSRGHRSIPKHHAPLSGKNLQHDLVILENWSTDVAAIQDLQVTLNRLLGRLAPWAKVHLSPDHSIDQMIQTLDSIAGEEVPSSKSADREHASRTVLENMVEHFMTLFDVPSIAGVFPRMNEIYTKLGEVHNVMHTLRNILGLENDSKSSAVVDSVGRLCQAHNSTTAKQLRQLLQTDDLDGVIRRLDEHRHFFPAFQEVMKKLIQILAVERMDQIVPAVRALKMLSH